MSSELQNKLRAILGNAPGLMTGSQWENRFDAMEQKRAEGAYEIDRVVPGAMVENDFGAFYRLRHAFPLDTAHGPVLLGDVLRAEGRHIALSANDAELVDFNPRATAFIDTETGGLVGGAGNVAFLIGVAYFEEDALVLEQCFLRDYDEEEAMLRHLDGLFKRFDAFVSYNGKTFDMPLLRTRFIQNRIPYRLDAAMHYDLLHAARRFWRRRIQNCSLANVEREVLGMPRHGDVNSALIPELWFDYLRSRDARALERVFYHHKTDILSLVALTAWVSRCLDAEKGGGFDHAEDRLSLLRVQIRQKRWEDAAALAATLLRDDMADEMRRETLQMAAEACKRLGRFDDMVEAWKEVVALFPRDYEARHGLAKYYEHIARDLAAAETVCADALRYLDTRRELGRLGPAEFAERPAFERRLARIRRKIGVALGD